MDEGRFDAYQRHIKIFERWLGANTLVDFINAPKLEEWWAYLSLKVSDSAYSPSYARTIFMTTKQFISRLGELGLIPLPGNIRSRRFKFGDGPKAVDRLTIEEVKTLLSGCNGFSERTKLFVLLMLNCGMYQSDISDIGEDEVDWVKGTLSRPRSKTPKGPRVTYKLWPETLELLRKFHAKTAVPNDRRQSRVLLTEDGKPLVLYWLEDGKMRRYDCIQSAFSRLFEKVKMKKPIKLLRKTSASELASHPVYGAYVQYFLAHSPKGVADRHYIKPDDDRFFEALDWLGKRYGL
jgi:integrase